MMNFIDSFINTKDKRRQLFYLFTTILLFIFTSTLLLCASSLLFVQNEAHLQAFMTSELLQSNYLVRFFTALLKTNTFTLSQLLLLLLQSIELLEWLLLMNILIIEHHYFKQRKIQIFIGSYLLELCICLGMLLPLLNTQSFHQALKNFHLCGMVMMMFTFYQLVMILIWMHKRFINYLKALQYDVIEVPE